MKERARQQARLGAEPDYEPIEMPRNSATGFICAFFATFIGFALIWHIWWLVAVGLVGAYVDLRRLRLARPGRGCHSRRGGGAPRSRQPQRPQRGAGPRPGGPMSTFEGTADRSRSQSHRRGGLTTASRRRRSMPPGGLASKRIIVGYGFWIFLLSDIIMFSAFFAAYAVLVERDGRRARAGGSCSICPTSRSRPPACCSPASPAAWRISAPSGGSELLFYGAMAATCLLGAGFLGLEIHEFAGLVAHGDGPTRSAFLSAFFTLVGCHGLHVTAGLLWLLTMMAQVFAKGFRPDILRRILCFSLFWHALDIIWVAMFTIVYLMGVAA